MALGFDVGSYHLVCARRNKDGKSVDCTKEINAFIEIPLKDNFTFKMLEKAGVPLIKRTNTAYAVGEKAVNIAYSFGDMELRRPMKDGCVNPSEKESYNILGTMIHGMIGEITKNNEVLCYCIPSNAINEKTDVDYHREILKQIFSKYEYNGKKVTPYPINEALALVYAELQHKFLSGISASFGAGMVNVCIAHRSIAVNEFSIVNSGDWIDQQAAQAAAVSTTVINQEKMNINLLAAPKNEVERAIQTQYRIMIRKTVLGIKDGIQKNASKVKSDAKVDFVIAGGTSSPMGFEDIFRKELNEHDIGINIGEIIKPKDHLYAVARGCLEAAEAASEE